MTRIVCVACWPFDVAWTCNVFNPAINVTGSEYLPEESAVVLPLSNFPSPLLSSATAASGAVVPAITLLATFVTRVPPASWTGAGVRLAVSFSVLKAPALRTIFPLPLSSISSPMNCEPIWLVVSLPPLITPLPQTFSLAAEA